MQPAVSDPPDDNQVLSPTSAEPSDSHDAAFAQESRNFLVLAIYQIVMRMGWIFKTESIIMPAVLDTLGGGAWLRGCLPLLNRFGQSVPPLLMARRIKILPCKKWALACCTLVMSGAFLALALLWSIYGGQAVSWLPAAFLGLYALFFMSTGVNQLSFGTLQGKLIQASHRGRLLLVSNTVGAASAIFCAWLLLPLWLRPGGGDFGLIFAFAGVCFAVSSAAAIWLAEPADDYHQPSNGLASIFGSAWSTLADDANFRRLAIIGALFGASIMLFPHYQALGRSLGLPLDQLIWWVIVQNAGTALFSLVAGPVADRRGNRLVLRLAMLGISSGPLLAVLMTHIGSLGQSSYYLVFAMIGMTPVTFKTLNNYTLEISEPADHPRYLSTLSLCIAGPIFLSPLVGLLVDLIGFEPVFLGVAALIVTAWLLTFGLSEPRHHLARQQQTASITGE